MAHQINLHSNGKWSFASNGEKAWHGLGQVVDGAMTTKQAIENANLDYEVGKIPIIYMPNGEPKILDGYFATYRTDNMESLGVVKSRYEIVQNRDAFGFFDAIIDEGEAIFETAGVLGKGERIFLLAKLPEDFEVGGEAIQRYILLTNSHDGSSSVIAGMTNIRVVCNNTLQAALRKLDNKVSIDHVSGAKDKLKEAHRVMGIASKYNKEVADIMNRMVDVKMDEGQYRKFFEKIFAPETKMVMTVDEEKEMSTRMRNIIDSATEFSLTHPTQTTDAAKGTLWGAYNGVSGYYNYVKKFKTAEDKFTNQFYGQANKKMLKSFQEAVTMLN